MIHDLLHYANIVKLNDDELEIISKWFGYSEIVETAIYQFQEQFELEQVCLTFGAKGAYLFKDDQLHFVHGYPVEVKDTIGSGDAFLAAFVASYINNYSAEMSLKTAAAMGALVATHKGAMNTIKNSEIQDFIRLNN